MPRNPTAKQSAAARQNLEKARAAKRKGGAHQTHESGFMMSGRARIASKHGMTVAEYKKKLAKDSAAFTRQLTKQLGYNPLKPRMVETARQRDIQIGPRANKGKR